MNLLDFDPEVNFILPLNNDIDYRNRCVNEVISSLEKKLQLSLEAEQNFIYKESYSRIKKLIDKLESMLDKNDANYQAKLGININGKEIDVLKEIILGIKDNDVFEYLAKYYNECIEHFNAKLK